jgi:hypothetical protein
MLDIHLDGSAALHHSQLRTVLRLAALTDITGCRSHTLFANKQDKQQCIMAFSGGADVDRVLLNISGRAARCMRMHALLTCFRPNFQESGSLTLCNMKSNIATNTIPPKKHTVA